MTPRGFPAVGLLLERKRTPFNSRTRNVPRHPRDKTRPRAGEDDGPGKALCKFAEQRLHEVAALQGRGYPGNSQAGIHLCNCPSVAVQSEISQRHLKFHSRGILSLPMLLPARGASLRNCTRRQIQHPAPGVSAFQSAYRLSTEPRLRGLISLGRSGHDRPKAPKPEDR